MRARDLSGHALGLREESGLAKEAVARASPGHDCGPFDEGRSHAKQSVQLTPYDANKSASQSLPAAELWYDSVIVSRARIGDP